MTSGKYITSDKTIRKALIDQLNSTYGEKKDTAIIPEFSLSTTGTRADVAVVNGVLHGYELKGDLDTLVRLPRQIQGYNEIFDKITIVVGKKHVIHTIQSIPDWWGVVLAKNTVNDEKPQLIEIRKASQNTHQNILSILNLLWKEEIIQILDKENLYRRLSSASKNELCDVLISNLDIPIIKDYVRSFVVHRNQAQLI